MILVDIKKELFGAIGKMNLDISLEIEDEEFIAISGESGSGKTTFLRVLAGLESAEGKIIVDNRVWLDRGFFMEPQKRDIGFVFQDYALFPNMSVEQNLLFVKRDKKLAKYLLEITKLYNLKDRYPNSLSGGQKQRVAICRALMRRPKLLLMDEPLSALDPKMRVELQEEILSLHREFKLTTIMVSHDLAEIFTLSDRVVVMELGKIVKEGATRDILVNSKSHALKFRGRVLSANRSSAVIVVGKDLVEVKLDSSMELKIDDEVIVLVDSSDLKIQLPH